jgi:hypothetical protein
MGHEEGVVDDTYHHAADDDAAATDRKERDTHGNDQLVYHRRHEDDDFSIPYHRKRGHKCCGCCCDVRRAVIVVNIIMCSLLGLGLLASLAAFLGISSTQRNHADAAYAVAWLFAIIGWMAAILGLVGAQQFLPRLVGAAGCCYVLMAVRSLSKWSYTTTTIPSTSSSYDWFLSEGIYDGDYDDYYDWHYNTYPSTSTSFSIDVTFILWLLFAYPHFVLMSEIRRGIMSAETYKSERQSCCCV